MYSRNPKKAKSIIEKYDMDVSEINRYAMESDGVFHSTENMKDVLGFMELGFDPSREIQDFRNLI